MTSAWQDASNTLIERGWEQGALFAHPSLRPISYALSSDKAEAGILPIPRADGAPARWIVATQTCDISASVGREPAIEALACGIEPRERLGSLEKSARWFVVDFARGLVANAGFRVMVNKTVLLAVEPEPWPDSPERLRQFARWLGKRYNRPALPDELVDLFQRPVSDAFRTLQRDAPATVGAFSDAAREIRLHVSALGSGRFEVHVSFLLHSGGLTNEGMTALDTAESLIRRSVDPARITVASVRKVTDEQMSVAEYFATVPFYLDSYTYLGEDIRGSEPFGTT